MTLSSNLSIKLSMSAFSVLLSGLVAPLADAQIILQSGSFQTSSSANTMAAGGATCSDPDGAVNQPIASSACSDLDGNVAAGNAESIVSVDTRGADFALMVSGAGAVVVGAPGPFAAQANGAGLANALRNWFMSNDTLYSLSITTSEVAEGGSTLVSNIVDFSGGSAASGLLASGNYSLVANLTATAGGSETGILAGSASASAIVRLTFAEAASPTLISGTVTGGGIGQPGLLVEALDGVTLIDSVLTGDDGSYLLPDVTTAVTLRLSDPAGNFSTIESSMLAPPTSFTANLAPTAAVPALTPLMLGVMALAMAGAGRATRRV